MLQRLNTLTLIMVCVSLLLFGCGGNEKTSAAKQSLVNVSEPTKSTASAEAKEVSLSYIFHHVGEGRFRVACTTDLPDGFALTIGLSNQEIYAAEVMGLPANVGRDKLTDAQLKQIMDNVYGGSIKTTVKKGKCEVVFGGKNLKPGKYDLSISSSVIKSQPQEIRSMFGEKGEKLKGKHVVEGSGGRTVHLKERVVLKYK